MPLGTEAPPPGTGRAAASPSRLTLVASSACTMLCARCRRLNATLANALQIQSFQSQNITTIRIGQQDYLRDAIIAGEDDCHFLPFMLTYAHLRRRRLITRAARRQMLSLLAAKVNVQRPALKYLPPFNLLAECPIIAILAP